MRAGLGGPSPQREACALALVDGDSAAVSLTKVTATVVWALERERVGKGRGGCGYVCGSEGLSKREKGGGKGRV
jgi:hypothetical protein